MLINTLTRTTLVGLLVFVLTTAAAQETTGNGDDELRRYTVEVIIFKYNENVGAGNEIFLPDPVPESDLEVVFGDDSTSTEFAADAEVATPTDSRVAHYSEFTLLADDELTMNETLSHLRRLDVYEPVMHFGWTQTTHPDADTDPRPLAAFGSPPSGLNGELRLYLSRYLHLVVDLALEGPRVANAGSFATADSMPVRYRIQEDRIFKSGEIRYFDHPKFGMLAKISRVELQDPELEEFLGEPDLMGTLR